jgi:PAS domain S-box-containing protein
VKKILFANSQTTQEKDLTHDQLIKYAEDFARLYESERQQRVELLSTNRRLKEEIHARRSLEEALVTSEKKYRDLFQDSRDPMYITSREGILLIANPAYWEFFKYEEKELIGTSVLKLYADPSQRPIFQQAIEENDVLKNFEIKLLTKNGEIRDCLVNAFVRKHPHGEILGYQGILHDVTEQREKQQMMELSNRMESLAFMAGGVAHEIKNPLSISSSAAQLLLNTGLDTPAREECLEKVLAGITRASLIVDNLVTFARDLGQYSLTKVNLAAVIQSALDAIAIQAGSQDVAIKTRFCKDKIFCRGSEELLHRAFSNLFLNGLSAMPEGGVLFITVDKNGYELTVCTIDSGHGMPYEQVARIFDPFFSGFAVRRGLGLGLSVASRIVSQHGGTIKVDSVLGKGSTFTVRLPEQSP